MPWHRTQPSHTSVPAVGTTPGRALSSAPRSEQYAALKVFLSSLSLLYIRTMLAKPLLPKDSIQVLISPLSLKPHVLDEVSLAAHAQALKQRYRCCILTVCNRDHTMQLQRSEDVIQD